MRLPNLSSHLGLVNGSNNYPIADEVANEVTGGNAGIEISLSLSLSHPAHFVFSSANI